MPYWENLPGRFVLGSEAGTEAARRHADLAHKRSAQLALVAEAALHRYVGQRQDFEDQHFRLFDALVPQVLVWRTPGSLAEGPRELADALPRRIGQFLQRHGACESRFDEIDGTVAGLRRQTFDTCDHGCRQTGNQRGNERIADHSVSGVTSVPPVAELMRTLRDEFNVSA